MKIERQTELRKVLSPVVLPKMAVIEQHFPDDAIQDVPAYLRERLMPEHIRSRIQPGMKVVLTGSSRQIHDMPVVLRELASFVKAQGAQPYIIPAMGSHAGGIAEKQKELLEGYGITEAFCGCPIYSSMETVQVGALDNGDEVRVDRFAHAADAVIVVGRIKAHTSFSGPYESGLVKMMAWVSARARIRCTAPASAPWPCGCPSMPDRCLTAAALPSAWLSSKTRKTSPAGWM